MYAGRPLCMFSRDRRERGPCPGSPVHDLPNPPLWSVTSRLKPAGDKKERLQKIIGAAAPQLKLGAMAARLKPSISDVLHWQPIWTQIRSLEAALVNPRPHPPRGGRQKLSASRRLSRLAGGSPHSRNGYRWFASQDGGSDVGRAVRPNMRVGTVWLHGRAWRPNLLRTDGRPTQNLTFTGSREIGSSISKNSSCWNPNSPATNTAGTDWIRVL